MNRGSRHFSSVVSKGEPVNGLRILGIDLEGPVEIVEGLQAIALFAEYGVRVLEGDGIPWVGGQRLHGMLLGLMHGACVLAKIGGVMPE